MKLRYYNPSPGNRINRKKLFLINLIALFSACVQWLLCLFHSFTVAKRSEKKYHVSVCLIFKNEARFLREWIEYHRLIGVDHFYLYNNDSDDDFREILNEYIDQGLVTLTEWPFQHAQIDAYRDCYSRFAHETQWIAYIDADEFINLQYDNDLPTLLHRYRHHPGLFLHWRDFGTSGYISAPDNSLVTERYVAAWPWLCNVGKTIINTDYDYTAFNVHFFGTKFCGIPLFAVNDCYLPVPYMPTIWRYGMGRRVYLNHYFSKDYDWYIYKDHKRGDAMSVENVEVRKRKGRFESHELNNYVHDYSIQRWLIFLRLALHRNSI